MESRHVVISGCSGGGKSTLLAELRRRGFAVASEPGRRIVQEELRRDGVALPWVDLAAFANRALVIAAADRMRMSVEPSWVFFDRGLVDAAVALQHATGQDFNGVLSGYDRYYRAVFMTPPWPEIFVNDTERQHDLDEAVREYERLLIAYCEMGYDIVVLPKVENCERADFVLAQLS